MRWLVTLAVESAPVSDKTSILLPFLPHGNDELPSRHRMTPPALEVTNKIAQDVGECHAERGRRFKRHFSVGSLSHQNRDFYRIRINRASCDSLPHHQKVFERSPPWVYACVRSSARSSAGGVASTVAVSERHSIKITIFIAFASCELGQPPPSSKSLRTQRAVRLRSAWCLYDARRSPENTFDWYFGHSTCRTGCCFQKTKNNW